MDISTRRTEKLANERLVWLIGRRESVAGVVAFFIVD